MAALSAFAISVLSVEQAMERGRESTSPSSDQVTTTPAVPTATRTSRRATSHYNSFQTHCTTDNNAPPCYKSAVRHRAAAQRPEEGCESLPAYSCTVSAEAKVWLNLELINPMHTVSESEWREVYIVLRGTMLNIHRVKDGICCGKLLRSYTLQHAEIGLATDTTYTVLTPNTKLAHLIPGPARERAYKKDPRLFKAQTHHSLRIRVETDQLLFAQPSEQATHDLINAISAAIDISQPIDERSIPRQCTVPRRRRRNRPQFNGDVNDPTLVADQERILRQMYPSLVQPTPAAREEDEIDVSALREETPRQRPSISRTTSQTSTDSDAVNDAVTDPANLTVDGKWQPAHNTTEAQMQRYTRRCMPILLAEATRASDVLIYNGQRVRINWRHESLDPWELKPPSYRLHGFEKPALERSTSTTSASSDQLLSQAETPLEEHAKVLAGSHLAGKGAAARAKLQRVEIDAMTSIPGIVYCF